VKEIVPSTGSHRICAFHPSLAMTPSLVNDEEDESVAMGNKSKSGGGSASNVGSAVASDANIVMHPPTPSRIQPPVPENVNSWQWTRPRHLQAA
jgi:hypothetical protein